MGFRKTIFILILTHLIPLGDPTVVAFSGAGYGVAPAPGSPEAPIQLASSGGGGSVIAEQAEQLNVGLLFQGGQWIPE